MFNENRLKQIELFATQCASDMEYVHDEALKYVMACGNGRSSDFKRAVRVCAQNILQLEYSYADNSVILFAARKKFKGDETAILTAISNWKVRCDILCFTLFGQWKHSEGIVGFTMQNSIPSSKNQVLVWMKSKKKTW